jgi:hypothetical protein
MPPLLLPQTDRRALNITLNSIGTELTRDDRKKLYSNFGLLYPHGHNELAAAEDFDQVRLGRAGGKEDKEGAGMVVVLSSSYLLLFSFSTLPLPLTLPHRSALPWRRCPPTLRFSTSSVSESLRCWTSCCTRRR